MSSRKVIIRKNSLSYFVLLALEKAVDGYIRLEDFTSKTNMYAFGGRWEQNLPKSTLAQTIKRLREKGFLEADIDSDKVIFKLTSLGKDALGNTTFKEAEWDGKWRIVIFDIPENKRKIRVLFRRRLVQWGFKKWQLSVWVTKENITEKLRNLITNLEIEDWVAVIESDNVMIDHTIWSERTK
ncbi:CRISPR-associated endonuclease Cas2 [Candidatus Daviesbacteria bacterium]|nr:CRISPR-associated endonuclease Cas2 [Candidatus Daviesbacteria bacterium]